jgi:hypothetical protein
VVLPTFGLPASAICGRSGRSTGGGGAGSQQSATAAILDLDLSRLGFSDRPLAAADFDSKGISQRRDRHDADLRARHQSHLEQAPPKRAWTVDAVNSRRLPQWQLGERRRHHDRLPLLKIVFNIKFGSAATGCYHLL